MRSSLSILAVAMLVTAPSWAINKCICADGKVSYQAQACAGGTSKTIKIQPAPPAASQGGSAVQSAAPSAQTSEQRTLARFERDRRIREVKDQIAGLERDVEQRNRRMQTELDALRYRKSFANNNLAGATYEQSLSTEMQAVTSRTRAQNDVDFERIKALRSELAGIEAGKP